MGLQAAVLVFGYLCMPDKRPDEKADHWFGKIYAITDRFIERDEEVLAELKTKWPGVFNRLVPILQHKERVREQVRELMAKCEAGDPRVMRKFRQVARLCLAGFKTTLSQLGISFDSYDFESDFVLDGSVYRVVERLKRRGALKQSPEKTWFLDLEELNLPSLVLVRSDGTTLYVTRDVAYSMWKFRECEVQRVINVIGKEQSLAQAQVRAALSLLGHEQWANSLTHYAYEHVRFPGVTISGRRGRYLTIDELIREAVRRAEGEVMKRAPGLSERARRKTSRAIALGAIKYAILRVEPAKLITFDLDQALSFEGDTGPYIQYAHTRCCGILRKARRWTPRYKVQTLTDHEKVLIRLLGRFSQVVESAARELSPHQVCAYAFDLATAFSTFYQFCPVLRAKPPSLRNFRLTLVKAVQTVLRDVCDLMGIEAPHRM
jgi:arginyl-tRNA synthetase